jgi:serine/threonine protein phosphatase PrpC
VTRLHSHKQALSALIAAGGTDPGLHRRVNEDRFHCDETRGLFIVIDGIGGQAAGGKAADVALSMLRERLERETGPIRERVREAIAIANNEIYRLASTRPEWDGMACVLTVAVVKGGTVTVGHVGDTRLYELRDDGIEKITRDHSPVGEREDARDLSEFEAMRHPRRNEVYRDVGSEPHAPADPEFVDLLEIPFEADSALLLCSDGLTDLVDSASIARIVRRSAGSPEAVVRALIDAANAAGGKDNVTVVYVEGERFAKRHVHSAALPGFSDRTSTDIRPAARRENIGAGPLVDTVPGPSRLVRGAIIALLLVLVGFSLQRTGVRLPSFELPARAPLPPAPAAQIVQSTESIAAAIDRAPSGSEIVVEPGEYRERLLLRDNVRLVSRVPRGATIRLPATASDAQAEPAVVAAGLSRAELVGFRIIGDAKTPLGVGILVASSGLSIMDVEVSGATKAGVSFAGPTSATLVGSEIHDNPGAALSILAGATPRITQNVFSRNGLSQHAPGTFIVQAGAAPFFQRNVFVGISAEVFAAFDETARARVKSENWFISAGNVSPTGGSTFGPRRRNQ